MGEMLWVLGGVAVFAALYGLMVWADREKRRYEEGMDRVYDALIEYGRKTADRHKEAPDAD